MSTRRRLIDTRSSPGHGNHRDHVCLFINFARATMHGRWLRTCTNARRKVQRQRRVTADGAVVNAHLLPRKGEQQMATMNPASAGRTVATVTADTIESAFRE